jgi:hypothetical protein
MYNVRVLDHFWPLVVTCLGILDAVRIGDCFYYNLHVVTTINYNYFLRFCAFTQLQSLHASIPFYLS